VAAPENNSSMGAVLYFGLIGFALIAASPGPVTYLNPKETMRRITFDASPDDAVLSDPFSWPVATQNVDASLDKVALLSMQNIAVGIRPNASQDSFTAPTVPVTFRPNPAFTSISNQTTPRLPTSVDRMARSNFDLRQPQAASNRPDLDGFLLESFDEPLVSIDFDSNDSIAPIRENQFHNSSATPGLALTAALQDSWNGQPDAPWAGITTGDRVYLRASPALTGEPIDLISIDTRLLVTQSRGDWVRVEVAGNTGWMFAEFVGTP